MTATPKSPPQVPRWLVRTIWIGHRTVFRLTGGRFGLRSANSTRWGMLRLHTVGRRSGQERIAILGYIEDGPNIVTPAMNGWADPEPAWWLNLQANPEATIELPRRHAPGGCSGGGRRGAGAAVAGVPRPGELGLHRGQRRPPVARDGDGRARAASRLGAPPLRLRGRRSRG